MDSPPDLRSHAARGRLGARKRWGPDGRIVRLDRLDPLTREIVVSILRARKDAAGAVTEPERVA